MEAAATRHIEMEVVASIGDLGRDKMDSSINGY